MPLSPPTIFFCLAVLFYIVSPSSDIVLMSCSFRRTTNLKTNYMSALRSKSAIVSTAPLIRKVVVVVVVVVVEVEVVVT